MKILKQCRLEALVRLMKAATDFQKASTTAYLRRLVSRAIKEARGWNVSAKIVVRLKFDDRIKLVEVRKVVNDKLMGVYIPSCLMEVARSTVRIVWVKNPSVADMLHNQRAFAKVDVSICMCADLPYPKVGGHVQVRLQDLTGMHPLLCNANNIPKLTHLDREGLLIQEIERSVQSWANWRGEKIHVTRQEATKCMIGGQQCKEKYLDPREVRQVKSALEGLVLTPLDMTPGETLVLCPKVYYEAMMETFVLSPGYVIETDTEEKIFKRMKDEAASEGLQQVVRWDKKGKICNAYVMPKHKDLSRYKPNGICPTYSEPTDMFSKLPHEDIIEDVDWALEYHRSKGRQLVRVNTKGKGGTFGRTMGDDHWRTIDMEDIGKYVRWELRHTFTKATGVILRQAIGIPMGKSSSPILTCLMCAYAEFWFLQSLGRLRKDVFGMRLMNDVSIVIHQNGKKLTPVEEIKRRFETCYPDNLCLKRTDEGEGIWDFLGTTMNIDPIFPYVRCIQSAKDEESLWQEERWEFKCGQSYRSWGSKEQKSAVVSSFLQRIDRNTNNRAAIPRRVLSVQRELRIKEFLAGFLKRMLKRFARGRDDIWSWTYEWLYG
ncbi:hypothetical protein CBR_g4465 [Chara braunii]|uniref:Reverse transcriptase domain-containing protein n=1 Tax=Chara braunii TaxID=69332 RepID=A0A388KHV5_CHABU|nr:hypothetical protein CBR_g4465 [Chara braunii]|eukprot:GBG69635.1 hypothetical protein CBR_g4465 [Chara braunii]